MDLSKINISKSNLHSEDYVGYSTIQDRFCIIINSDGMGSTDSVLTRSFVIKNKCNDVYEFDEGNLQLGSTIAITTHYYSNYILNIIKKNIENYGFNLEKITNSLSQIMKEITNEKNNTCFCIKITIFDLHKKKMCCYNSGDCGHTLISLDKDKGELLRSPLSEGIRLSFNGRGTGVIKIPYTINNYLPIHQQQITLHIYDLPKNFIFIQYSDGLDYDIAIPLAQLEKQLKRTIDFNVDDFGDTELLKHHHLLVKKELGKDKPNVEYVKYNLTQKELKHLATREKNSKQIVTDIIRSVSNVHSSRRKVDDISLCVFKYVAVS